MVARLCNSREIDLSITRKQKCHQAASRCETCLQTEPPLLPPIRFCPAKTHQPHDPRHGRSFSTAPADSIGIGKIILLRRTDEWLKSQLNCPNLQTLSPKAHPVSFPFHLAPARQLSLAPNSSGTPLLWCSPHHLANNWDTHPQAAPSLLPLTGFYSPKTHSANPTHLINLPGDKASMQTQQIL